MEEKKTSGSVPCEGQITAAVNGWLERWWRVGKVPAKAKASLCNLLLYALTAVRVGCDSEFLRLTDALYDELDGIRHVRTNCTQRFMNALVRYVAEGNDALRRGGVNCQPLVIPLRGGDGAETAQSARVPAGAGLRDRTLVPVGTAPVTLDAGALGRTVVSITIVRGKVTVNVTQDQSPRPNDARQSSTH